VPMQLISTRHKSPAPEPFIQLATESTLIIAPPPFFARIGAKARANAQRPDKVHFKLLARGFDRAVGEKTARPCNTGIVDEQADVPGRARRSSDLFVAVHKGD